TSFSITRAPSATTVTDSGGQYNGSPYAATAAEATGTNLDDTTLAHFAFSYSGTSYNGTAYGPTSTAPTNAGSYSVTATYAGDDNHSGSQGSTPFTITQATATFDIHPYSVVIDGNPHTAIGTATGVGGVTLPSTDLDFSHTTH